MMEIIKKRILVGKYFSLLDMDMMCAKRRFKNTSKGIVLDTKKLINYNLKNDEEICDLLNDLDAEILRVIDFKNRFKNLSSNAHDFLRCYEKAIEELYDKYPLDSKEHNLLDELDDLYCKYENEVDLK